MTGIVLVIVLITKFTRGAWIAIAAMAVFYGLMLAIQKHYDRVAAELVAGEYDSVLPSRNHGIVLVVHAAQADAAGRRLRQGDPPRRAGGGHRQRRRRGHQEADAGLGQAQDPGAVEGHRVAVPGDHPAGARLRQADPHRQPARRGHRVHPGVRGRALVGADPAQPERAAAQGAAAVHPRGDGHQRALAAGVLGAGGQPPPGDAAGLVRRGYEPAPGRRRRCRAANASRTPSAAPGSRRSD